MTILRDSAIMGAATFLVGAVFMEVGDDEQDFDKTFPYIATFLSGAIGYYLLKKTNITDSFSAEEKVTREYLEHDYKDITKFSYHGNEALYEYDADEKTGELRFINSFKEDRMGQGDWLPHAERISDIKGKATKPKKIFKAFLDRPCESCNEPIYKHGIGNCFDCVSDFDKEFKYAIGGVDLGGYEANMNRYCRKCLFYADGFGDTNMPNEFDRKGSNYSLGTARCDEHFNEMIEEKHAGKLAEGKKVPKHSLYDIENYNAYREMALRRRRKD
jgi:hypothetical protein